jgi:hypothetical protein
MAEWRGEVRRYLYNTPYEPRDTPDELMRYARTAEMIGARLHDLIGHDISEGDCGVRDYTTRQQSAFCRANKLSA